MNEIQASRLVHDRYRIRFSQLLHKLNRSIVGHSACSVSKACGDCRTSQGEMRGPLKEQIQNAINRALKENIVGNNQAAYINVGGRRRNRKKKKAKKNNGVSGSAWSTLVFQVDEPPARCLVEIPPKAKGSSPQVTKAKKACKETCKELKARLSPPRSCPKDASAADDKPLIGNEAAEDENEALSSDQENIDPSNMPLSSLFKKSKKSKKDKKAKGKDAIDTNVADDVTGQAEAQAQEQTPLQAASPPASDVIVMPPADDVTKTEQAGAENKPIEGAAQVTEENNVTDEQSEKGAAAATTDTNNISDSKTTDMLTREAGQQDTPAVLQTTEMGAGANLTLGEGPQLTQSPTEEAGTAAVVDTQPKAVDGSLPPDTAPTGREKLSLLHDHNPEGMVCCTIL